MTHIINVSAILQSGPGQTKQKKPKPLLKRYTFQEASANAYAVNMFQVGMGGETLLSRSPSNQNFAFSVPSPTSSPKSPASAVFNF